MDIIMVKYDVQNSKTGLNLIMSWKITSNYSTTNDSTYLSYRRLN
jgi:hypothetical protein